MPPWPIGHGSYRYENYQWLNVHSNFQEAKKIHKTKTHEEREDGQEGENNIEKETPDQEELLSRRETGKGGVHRLVWIGARTLKHLGVKQNLPTPEGEDRDENPTGSEHFQRLPP